MKKLFILILFLAVSAGLIWLVWFRPVKEAAEEKKPEPEVPVHVGTITRTTLRQYVTAYGAIEPEPKAGARIAVGVPGVVSTVNCVEGQMVERGTLLFELDNRAAEVAVNFAEKSLERQKKLALVDGTSQKLLQEAEQLVAAARAQQALLQIRSPINGTITKVGVKPGEAADLTTVLAEVVDMARLTVSFNVAGEDLSLLKGGQPTEITAAGATNWVQTTIAFVGSQTDLKTGSGIARAPLPPNSGLRVGQFVKVRVVVSEHKDCLAVPEASVAKDVTGAFFVALVDGDKAVLKPVKTGLRDGELVEVEGEGVEPDKAVVTEGAYGLIMTQQFATKIRVLSE